MIINNHLDEGVTKKALSLRGHSSSYILAPSNQFLVYIFIYSQLIVTFALSYPVSETLQLLFCPLNCHFSYLTLISAKIRPLGTLMALFGVFLCGVDP